MRRRVLTALLALCMAVSLLPVHALAVDVAAGSGLDTLGIRQISEKKYAVTPDVTEYEWILNNTSLTQQMMGHVMEIKVGEGSTASVAVGYSDFITAAFATRRRPIYSGVVQIGLKRVDNGSNTYSVATFRLVQRFEGNDLLQIKQYADGFREQIKAMNQQRAMEAELGNNEPICDAVDSSYHSTDDGEHFCITEAPIDGDHEDLPM